MPTPSTTSRRGTAPTARRRRTIVSGAFAAALLLVLVFLVYASTPMRAEAGPLDDVRSLADVTVTETADSVVLSPAEPRTVAGGERGLVFFAGARVEPAAYAAKLSGIAREGITVVIVRPVLGFGILEWRPIETFTALAPGVDSWLVGGHSLGGVRACQYIADDEDPDQGDVALDGLVLVGSYCSADISDSDVAVLSIAGSEDGLSTPETITNAARLLPTSTEFVELEGASHASFGDYGSQPGDGVATADDTTVTRQVAAAVAALD